MGKEQTLMKDKKFCLAEFILFLVCIGFAFFSVCLIIKECVIASCFALLLAFIIANIIIVFPYEGS